MKEGNMKIVMKKFKTVHKSKNKTVALPLRNIV